jgi:hypothetical protein
MDRPPEPLIVFLDACVLYPPFVRGVVLGMGRAGLFRPTWSPRVLAEWRIAAARKGGGGVEATVDTAVSDMTAGFPEACVTPDPAIEAGITLPDPADAHVLAGAIAAGAGVLLTFNMRDFPARRLAGYGITPRHPDGFLWELFSGAPEAAGSVIQETSAKIDLSDADAIRRALKRARLSRFAKAWFAWAGAKP